MTSRPDGIDWRLLAATDFPERLRPQVTAAWTHRALDEHRSHVAFARLAGKLRAIGAAEDLIAGADRIVRDEQRHVALCARVLERLEAPPAPLAQARFVAPGDAARPIDEVAFTCVASLAVGESVSFALIGAARRETEHPVLRAVTTSILRDEAYHGRFGFAWIAACWRSLPYATRLYVTSRLPAALGAVARAAPERAALVERTLERRILPKLDALGVPATASWRARP